MLKMWSPTPGWLAFRWHGDVADVPGRVVRAIHDLEGVPGAEVNTETVFAEIPFNMLGLHAVTVLGSAAKRNVSAVAFSDGPLVDVSLRRPLFPHQRAAVAWLVAQQGGVLADQMGLGKTASAAAAATVLAQEAQRPVLIVGPTYVRESWRQELEALGLAEELPTLHGTRPSFERGASMTFGFSFIHYEILHAWAPAIRAQLRPGVVIFDEAHWIKNPRSKRGQVAKAVATGAKVIGLTGTPMLNRTRELWNILQLVDKAKSWGSEFDFRRRYCGAYRGEYGWVDGQPTYVEELRTRLRASYLRRTVEDVGLDMPPFSRRAVYVELDAAARKQHADTLEQVGHEQLFGILQRGGGQEETLRLLNRLRRLTSKAKLKATADFVASCLRQEESVLVFTWERRTAERLETLVTARMKGCGSFETELVHGGLSQRERDEAVERFQRNTSEAPTPCALFSTLDALKEGVTLTRARHVVMHDLSWVPADALQAEARIHRIGQTKACTSTWMLARASIDTLMAQAIVRKGDEQHRVLGIDAAEQAARDLGFVEANEGDGLDWARDEAQRVMRAWQEV